MIWNSFCSISSDFSPPKTSLPHSKLHPQGFFGLDKGFLHFVTVLILSFSCIWPNFLGFFEKFWGFSKLMKLVWNFWNGLCSFDLKTSCIASHLHYNIVSCILRCVFTLLSTCVLVGLNWAEPMMFLLLHITCSYIFMHKFFTFYIFLYIELFWDFSDCLFLPPPLTL